MTTLKINGTEIAHLIKMDGFKWARNDVDGPGAGRALNAMAIRDRIASKIRLDCSCIPLTAAQRQTLENLLLADEFVTVSCDDSIFRGLARTMYCNAMSGGFSHRTTAGTEYWKDVQFVLVEQ